MTRYLFVLLSALMLSLAVLPSSAQTVGSGDLKKNAVRSKHIKKNNVKSSDIKNETVQGKDIKDETLTSDDLGSDSVGTSELQTEAVTTTKIANGAVGPAELSSAVKAVGLSGMVAIPGSGFVGACAAAGSCAVYSEGRVSSSVALQVVAAVAIPDGAVVTRFVAHYLDNAGLDARILLQRQNLSTGASENLADVIIDGKEAVIREFEDTTIVNSTVDLTDYSYYVVANVGDNGDRALYAVKIFYD